MECEGVDMVSGGSGRGEGEELVLPLEGKERRLLREVLASAISLSPPRTAATRAMQEQAW